MLQPLKTYVLHTYNTRNNPQLRQPTQKSFPFSNTIFPSASHFPFNGVKEYNLIENLKNIPAKISL